MVSACICLLQQLPEQASPRLCWRDVLEEQPAAGWVAEPQVALAKQPFGLRTRLQAERLAAHLGHAGPAVDGIELF